MTILKYKCLDAALEVGQEESFILQQQSDRKYASKAPTEQFMVQSKFRLKSI